LEIICSIIRITPNVLSIEAITGQAEYRNEKLIHGLPIYAFGFNLTSGTFIIFFWLNLLSMKLFKGNLLEKSFWPCFGIVTSFWVLIIITSSIFFAFGTAQKILTYVGVALCFICFILAIIYFYTAHRVLEYSKTRSGSQGLKIIAWKIIGSGICFVLIILALVLLIVPFRKSPPSSYTLTFVLQLFISMRSLLQIDVFGTIKKKEGEVINMSKTPNNDSSATNTQ